MKPHPILRAGSVGGGKFTRRLIVKQKLIVTVSGLLMEDEVFEATGLRVDAGMLSLELGGRVVMLAPGTWSRAEVVEVEADA